MSLNSVITFNEDGTSQVPEDIYAEIKEKIIILLNTKKGEVPNDLDYGTELYKLVDYPKTYSLGQAIENEIRQAIGIYIPEVTIIAIIRNYDTQGLIKITVKYSIGNVSDLINLNI